MDLSALAALKAQLEEEDSTSEFESAEAAELSAVETNTPEVESASTDSLLEQLVGIIVPYLPGEAADFGLEKSFSELGLNQLSIWAIVAQIEEEFKVSLSDDMVAQWHNAQDMFTFLTNVTQDTES
ncbi:hypothetical protein BSR28_08230 [Boudabousia liubingyangii]|uniref:acyl carrier protein n=1 Tax=Boudabousia liubingyangii TaxID=1921764 RepID=UPI00093D4990|nr:acyl carrier protein [Boudabousia liubingyangii]OKL46496.1 hypothetical protein BSR28_08230 [Boudabousia liubingyangii]